MTHKPDSPPDMRGRADIPGASEVFLTVDRRAYDKAIQVSIGTKDHGRRLLGPKYDGNGKQLAKHVLTASDAQDIYEYIKPLLKAKS